jgi:hypothetical protein
MAAIRSAASSSISGGRGPACCESRRRDAYTTNRAQYLLLKDELSVAGDPQAIDFTLVFDQNFATAFEE